MGVTALELQEFWLMTQSLGTVLYMFAYVAGVLALQFVFMVGAFTVATWFVRRKP